MARYDDLNTKAIAYTTFVSSILLIIIILLGRALCYAWIENEDERKLADAHYTTSDQIVSEQKASIASYASVKIEVIPAADAAPADPEKPQEVIMEDRLHIPINDAKKLLLDELKPSPKT